MCLAVTNSCSRMRHSNAGEAHALKCRMCNRTDSNYHRWLGDRQLRRREKPHRLNNITKWKRARHAATFDERKRVRRVHIGQREPENATQERLQHLVRTKPACPAIFLDVRNWSTRQPVSTGPILEHQRNATERARRLRLGADPISKVVAEILRLLIARPPRLDARPCQLSVCRRQRSVCNHVRLTFKMSRAPKPTSFHRRSGASAPFCC